ncbi:hypothetical protein WG66_007387 [Moniliophthora roreri]|nr:hypothetical protein WG66_007387 [Moniliophthora roreri]
MQPKRAPVIDKVIIKYTGFKASLVTKADSHNAMQILKTDLGVLKLPLPANGNISVVEKGVMEFWWETTVGSTLDHTLHSKLEPKTDGEKAHLEKVLRNLSMCIGQIVSSFNARLAGSST